MSTFILNNCVCIDTVTYCLFNKKYIKVSEKIYFVIFPKSASHHEVDGGGAPGVGLHQSAPWLPGAEHQAQVPGHGDGDVRLAPGHQRLAVVELGGRHHCTGGRGQTRSTCDYYSRRDWLNSGDTRRCEAWCCLDD